MTEKIIYSHKLYNSWLIKGGWQKSKQKQTRRLFLLKHLWNVLEKQHHQNPGGIV